MLGVSLLEAEVRIWLCDGTREAQQEDVAVTWARGKMGMPGQYVPNTWPVCNTVLWSDGVTAFLSQGLCEGVLLNVPYIPAPSCHCCSNPATRSRRRFRLCHWRHCVLITLWHWWQELKRIIHSPLSCQRSHPLQSSRSGSLAHGRTRLPGQQWPWLWDASARTAMSSAAGLALSSPCSLRHLQFRFPKWKEQQVPSRGQSGCDNTALLLKTGTTCASARDCPGYASQRTVLQPRRCNFQLEQPARLSPFPCTLGWMLFCYQIVQTSPAPCSLSISVIWLHLAGVLWLSILWCNSGQ